jgi:hypothetical protein
METELISETYMKYMNHVKRQSAEKIIQNCVPVKALRHAEMISVKRVFTGLRKS